ncbi:MAG TPA: hypothetical protein VJA85_07620 [Candidatus Limnocylindria bacterium]|nr:hypothetical protein [Candidatus Limnocylindria bacterium]
MKRRRSQERDEADARAQADARREQLLAQLRDRETSNRQTSVPPAPDVAPPEPGSEAEPAAEADPGDSAEEVAD